MRSVDPIEIVSGLCAHEARLAGTDAERRAATWLSARLTQLGAEPRTESVYVHPQAPLVHGTHAALAVAASLVSLVVPVGGFALLLAVATSCYLDLTGRAYLLRRLFFRRVSQNVVATSEPTEPRARIVLGAHYDAPRSGIASLPKAVKLAARLTQLTGLPFSHYRVLFWAMAVLLGLLGARMAGVDSQTIAIVQVVPTLVLLGLTYLFIDQRLSPPSPGANDNASGVAAAIAAFADLEGRLEHAGLWLVLPGASEVEREGLRGFVRRHREELGEVPTFFLCLDSVGRGRLAYESAGGPCVSLPTAPGLLELADSLAEAGIAGEREQPLRLRHGLSSDAHPARMEGIAAITLTRLVEDRRAPAGWHRPDDLPETLDAGSIERASELARLLARAIDRQAERAPRPVRGRRWPGLARIRAKRRSDGEGPR